MCVLVLAYKAIAGNILTLAANRDEYFARPALPLAPWSDHADIVGGRDLEEGGSWLAVRQNGRFAAITNVRMGHASKGERSRGLLVNDFLLSDLSAIEFSKQLKNESKHYAPFNLLFGRVDDLYIYHSPRHQLTRLTHGVFTLSNGLPSAKWPKTEKLAAQMANFSRVPSEDDLLKMLADPTHPPVEDLPNTGIGTALERMLSPIFIHTPDYGTRASTVVRISSRGDALLRERGFHAGRVVHDQNHSFKLDLKT